MKEIEIKILNIDVEEIRNKLLDLGAEKIFDGEVHALTYDFPEEKLENNDEFLRVRTVGDKTEFCFKGKKEDSQFKTREEIQVTTSDFNETCNILERLGLKKFHDKTKIRESYKLGKVSFEIDTYPEFPTFLEIEAPTEEEVKEYVEKLGYTMEQTTNLGSYQLIEKYQK